MTVEEFNRKYLHKRPVILVGSDRNRAQRSFWNRSSVERRFGARMVPVGTAESLYNGREQKRTFRMTVAQFLSILDRPYEPPAARAPAVGSSKGNGKTTAASGSGDVVPSPAVMDALRESLQQQGFVPPATDGTQSSGASSGARKQLAKSVKRKPGAGAAAAAQNPWESEFATERDLAAVDYFDDGRTEHLYFFEWHKHLGEAVGACLTLSLAALSRAVVHCSWAVCF